MNVLTELELRQLLNAMCEHDGVCVVDWVNHNIRVLSHEKTDATKVLSTGPMVYRDILHEVKF